MLVVKNSTSDLKQEAIDFQFKGKFTEAIDVYRKILKKNPKDILAYYDLATVKKFTEYDNDIRNLERLAKRERDDSNLTYLLFALTKAFDDIGDYQKAWDYMVQANKLRRAYFKDYKVDQDLMGFKIISQTITNKLLESDLGQIYRDYETKAASRERDLSRGSETKAACHVEAERRREPIFILGMPRSGSSLLEQILSSHSEIDGAGEVFYMMEVLSDLRINPANENPLGISLEELKAKSQQYLDLLSKHGDKKYIIDKMPSNFFYLGFIKLMFPHAKIIHTKRDPVATCFSCYKRFFTDNQPFAFDLEDLSRYYKGYQALMNYWHQLFSASLNPIYDLNYEDLVLDFDKTLAGVLNFLGLEHEDACKRFYENDRNVKTASFQQIREPMRKDINKEVNNYKNYLEGPSSFF